MAENTYAKHDICKLRRCRTTKSWVQLDRKSTCLTFPLHGESLQTMEQVHALLERHSKATLGNLLSALRKRVNLHPTFDDQLARFLESGNIIVHRLHDVPGGYDMHSDEGRERLKSFLLQYMNDGDIVRMVLVGVLRQWTRQEGIDLPSGHHLNQRMQEHLDANVVPNLEVMIRTKGATYVPGRDLPRPS